MEKKSLGEGMLGVGGGDMREKQGRQYYMFINEKRLLGVVTPTWNPSIRRWGKEAQEFEGRPAWPS